MTWILDPLMPIFIPTIGFCALFMLIFGTWMFVTGRRKQLAMTSEQLERSQATDPALAPARAIYTTGMIDVRKQASNSKSNDDYGSSADSGSSD